MRCPSTPWNVAAACTVGLLWGVEAGAAERRLVDFQELSASIPAGFACGPKVTVTVRAPDDSAFTGDRLKLQKLIGGLRTILDYECPKTVITSLLIVGQAAGQEVFRGTASKNRNWLLADSRGSVQKEVLGTAQPPREPAQTIVPSPATAQQVQQNTHGWCSPAVNNVTGNVAITCNGVDPKALARLNEILDKNNLEPKERSGEVRAGLALTWN